MGFPKYLHLLYKLKNKSIIKTSQFIENIGDIVVSRNSMEVAYPLSVLDVEEEQGESHEQRAYVRKHEFESRLGESRAVWIGRYRDYFARKNNGTGNFMANVIGPCNQNHECRCGAHE